MTEPQGLMQFSLQIVPVPKGRPRVVGNRVYTPRKTAQFEKDLGWLVKSAAKLNGWKLPLERPVYVSIGVQAPTHTGDIDNYAKAILDACNGVVWRDDKQVVELNIRLWRGEKPGGISLWVRPLSESRLSRVGVR